MELIKRSSVWWGPPRKFSTETEDRKISWMELFYDLVYVIVISNITNHLARHPGTSGLLDYIFFFTMIYWGWLNGSLYHDLHGSEGLRTRLMTLWQMMIVAALVITINTTQENLLRSATIVLMTMQLFITYLWWSVGFYDKYHRRLNIPYTVLYQLSLAIMLSTLFMEKPVYIKALFFISLVLNYAPPFVVHIVNRNVSRQFSMSLSMTERMGLFTIIVFGEVVLGVVNGVSGLQHILELKNWISFALSVLIVFSMWWLFFTLCSDRQCKPGFVNSSLMQLVYIPTLMSLGMIGAGFSSLFEHFSRPESQHLWLIKVFEYSLGLFFLGIACIMFFLQYPERYARLPKFSQRILFLVAVVFIILAGTNIHISLTVYLITVLSVILLVILVMNIRWYSLIASQKEEENEKEFEKKN